MIGYLQGKIIVKRINSAILDVNNVGYKVFLTEETLNRIPENGESLKLYTYQYIREDRQDLYGFLTMDQLELFEALNDISGIGPKAALSFSSVGSLAKMKELIEKGETKAFDSIKGIGQKKMQKIILELTGKIRESSKSSGMEKDPAVDALVSLGFSSQVAKNALDGIPAGIDVNQRIKSALKILGRKS
ncbi:MAG: Holliday junction branch migration protein RuvA [Candidatus Parcubacteria bacterium]|nr:Holliday junction branch migration protein RuvA [Candidatus Parcubacteria bacterium]